MVTCPKTPKLNRVIAISDFLAEEVAEHFVLYPIGSDERIFKVSRSYFFTRSTAAAPPPA